MMEREYKVMIIPCKRCGKEFKLQLPMHIYQMMVAAAEKAGEVWSLPVRARPAPGRSVLAVAR